MLPLRPATTSSQTAMNAMSLDSSIRLEENINSLRSLGLLATRIPSHKSPDDRQKIWRCAKPWMIASLGSPAF